MIRRKRDITVYVVIAVAVYLSWLFVRHTEYETSGRFAYWLGWAGAICMFILFSYPVRKYYKWTYNLGNIKWWLNTHMVLGILGPLLIFAHCKFQTGSLNAAVAFWSMISVAISGVIGRYLYRHSTIDLHSEKKLLAAFKKDVKLDHDTDSLLWFVPHVRKKLLALEEEAVYDSEHAAGHWLRLIFVLPYHSWMVRLWCIRQTKDELLSIGLRLRWSQELLNTNKEFARELIVEYITLVMRTALFKGWAKLFALWHVVHIPFVFTLVFASIAHIIAVHAY
jgi:hypothetical protein